MIYKSYCVVHIHAATILLLVHVFNYIQVCYLVRIIFPTESEITSYVVQFQRMLLHKSSVSGIFHLCPQRLYVEQNFLHLSICCIIWCTSSRKKRSPGSSIIFNFYSYICSLFNDAGEEKKTTCVCITKITALGKGSRFCWELLRNTQMPAIILYLKDGVQSQEHLIHLFSPLTSKSLRGFLMVLNLHTFEFHLCAACITLIYVLMEKSQGKNKE